MDWQSTPVTMASFGHVEQLFSKGDLCAARREIEQALPQSLPLQARIEGLLLKSAICCASGPDWVLEGLAQCSEALTLCDKIGDLEWLLSRIQFHRGVCLFYLQNYQQACNAFAAVEPACPLYERAKKYRKSCDEDPDSLDVKKRRTAFEEDRPQKDYGSEWKTSGSGVSMVFAPKDKALTCRQRSRRKGSSTPSRIFSTSKSARLPIPHRWKLAT